MSALTCRHQRPTSARGRTMRLMASGGPAARRHGAARTSRDRRRARRPRPSAWSSSATARSRTSRRRGSAPSTTCPGWLYPAVWPFQQLGALAARSGRRARRPASCAGTAWPSPRCSSRSSSWSASGSSRPPSAGSARARRSARTSSCAATSTSTGESFVSGHAVLVAALAGVVTPYLPGTLEGRAVGPRRRGHVRAGLRRRPQPARRRLRRRARRRHRRRRQPGDRIAPSMGGRRRPTPPESRRGSPRSRVPASVAHGTVVAVVLVRCRRAPASVDGDDGRRSPTT